MVRPFCRRSAWLPALLAAMVLQHGAATAQLPSAEELTAALETTAAKARQSGLVWRTQHLWVEALRQRSPLVAAHHQGACLLGYSAFTPGRDFRWLFPALSPAQRAAWLAGVAHHELAHCAEHASASAAGKSLATSPRQQEALADLAFAMHVDSNSDDGANLVALLANLRSGQAQADPTHDTSETLRCYLQHRSSFQPPGDWLTRLQAWRQHCSSPDADTSDPPQVATAWAGTNAPQTGTLQPVARRK